MASVHAVINLIWRKFRAFLQWFIFMQMRKRSLAKIKAQVKLTLKRRFAQYKEWDKLENAGV